MRHNWRTKVTKLLKSADVLCPHHKVSHTDKSDSQEVKRQGHKVDMFSTLQKVAQECTVDNRMNFRLNLTH